MNCKFLFCVFFTLAVAGLATLSCGTKCSRGYVCPVSFYLEVTGPTDGGALNGVEAVLSGPKTIIMSCDPSGSCGYFGNVPSGDYTLKVTAPEFQTTEVPATLEVVLAECGCPAGIIEPSALTLSPSGERDAAAADAASTGEN